MRNIILWCFIAVLGVHGGEFDKVKITPDMAYLYAYHKGKAVRIHRIQDINHKLTGEYAKTYRPGTAIQPVHHPRGVATIGEVELLTFIKDKVNRHQGLILDVRDRDAYRAESIPSAVNVPYALVDNPEFMAALLKILGMRKKLGDGYDGTGAMALAIYCNGLWCNKSARFIDKLLAMGYPHDKLLYYRGGFQMWKILGFTTVKN